MFDRLRALSTQQQVLLVALVASAACVLMVAVWFLFLRVSYQPIFTDLRPGDAAAIIADLDQKKIPYELENGGATILVPSDVVDRTRLNVMTGDAPLKGTTGFELFDKSDMGLTDFTQKINYQRALQGELERTIAMLDGIDSARVHLSLGEDRIFRDDRVPPKASVMVRMQKGFAMSADAAAGVQRLVAAAVPNLEVENVVILDEKGGVISAAPQVSASHDAQSPLAQEKLGIEQYYQARVRQVLATAYPLTSMTVVVSAGIGTAAANAPAMPEWNPAARAFPLMVTVTPPDTLDAAATENVHSLVATAIGSDPGKNDSIVLASSTAVAPVNDRVVLAAHKIAPLMDDADPADTIGSDQYAVAIAVLLMLLAAAGFFLWQGRRPRRMSDEQHADVAARFRALLDPGSAMTRPDRALRRLVVDLAARPPEDVASVLELLDAPQRKIVEDLLREFFNFGEPAAATPQGVDTQRVSPWLVERIQSGATAMTVAAAEALRDCALRLYPAPQAQRPRRRPFGSLFAKRASA